MGQKSGLYRVTSSYQFSDIKRTCKSKTSANATLGDEYEVIMDDDVINGVNLCDKVRPFFTKYVTMSAVSVRSSPKIGKSCGS